MKLLSCIRDIPEFNNENVHIRNEQELLEKINKIIKDGHQNLQIVTDFDHTLTKHSMENGSTVLTSFGKSITPTAFISFDLVLFFFKSKYLHLLFC